MQPSAGNPLWEGVPEEVHLAHWLADLSDEQYAAVTASGGVPHHATEPLPCDDAMTRRIEQRSAWSARVRQGRLL